MRQKIKICPLADLPDNRSQKFSVPDQPEDREGFVIRHEGRIHAYFNECAHISLPLDLDDNDFFSLDFRTIVCKNHGAEFEPHTGQCVVGPCKGAALKKIETIEEDGHIYVLI